MKIRIAILEQDKNYLQRLLSAFETKYEDKVEMYSFTDEKLALNAVINNRINVFLTGDKFAVSKNQIPDKCGFAYLTDTPNIETFNNERAICKFQKIDLIYKEIISLYSENTVDKIKNYDEGSTRMIVFTSPSGGTGVSTVSVACAKYFARCGKKTLYFNTEELGDSSIYFTGEGQFTFDDLIYAVKSKKPNIKFKFESTVKQDISGVYFFSPGDKALDIIDLTREEMNQLIVSLKMSGIFEVIIWDMDYSFQELRGDRMELVSDIVLVSDGQPLSLSKFRRMYDSLEELERQRKVDVIDKMWIVYNKFSNKMSRSIGVDDIKELGGAPRYEHATVNQIIEQLLMLNIYEKLLMR